MTDVREALRELVEARDGWLAVKYYVGGNPEHQNAEQRFDRAWANARAALSEPAPAPGESGMAEPLIDAIDDLIANLDYELTAADWEAAVKELRFVRLTHLIRSQRKEKSK